MVSWPSLSRELRESYAAVDWDASPLGPPETWSDTLRGAVGLMTNTRFAVTLLWGPEFAMLYNDAYVAMIGEKHPAALGRPAQDVFPEAWTLIGPMLQSARDGSPTWVVDEHIPLMRRGFLEECYFTFSYSAVENAQGRAEGVIDIAAETTTEVITRRRLALLTELAVALGDAEDDDDVAARARVVLRGAVADLAAVDLRHEGDLNPDPDLPQDPVGWSAGSVWSESVFEKDDDGMVGWLPIAPRTDEPTLVLVVRLSDRLPWDDEYRAFLGLLAGTLASSVERVRLTRSERARREVEHETLLAMQSNLLPPPVGQSDPVVAVRYVPAVVLSELGGDWYDSFYLSEDSMVLVVGDVAGHDAEAAASMAEARNVLRGVAYSLREVSPAEILRGVDRAVLGGGSDIVATAVVAVVRRRDGGELDVTWSSAGHPPFIVVDADGAVQLTTADSDLLLGVDNTTERHDHHLSLPVGATLVMFTDGLVERPGEVIDLGLATLADQLTGSHDVDVETLSDHVVASVQNPSDDIALLILRA